MDTVHFAPLLSAAEHVVPARLRPRAARPHRRRMRGVARREGAWSPARRRRALETRRRTVEGARHRRRRRAQRDRRRVSRDSGSSTTCASRHAARRASGHWYVERDGAGVGCRRVVLDRSARIDGARQTDDRRRHQRRGRAGPPGTASMGCCSAQAAPMRSRTAWITVPGRSCCSSYRPACASMRSTASRRCSPSTSACWRDTCIGPP